MHVKRILAKLRKERRMIDEAIAALEQIEAQPKSLSRNSSAGSRLDAPVPPTGNTARLSDADLGTPETKVIDFPRNQRAG